MSTEYIGLNESGVVELLGSFDCWDDLEYDILVDDYLYIWTRKSFTHFISYGVMILGKGDDDDI